MKALIACLLAIVVGFSIACSSKVTPETPKAAAALRADAIVIRVNEVQAAVIQACGPAPECAPGTLSTTLANQLVQSCVDLLRTLKSVPDGWQMTVKTAWATARPRFAIVTNQLVLAAVAALDTVIGGL